jgi:hypothetical protein
MKQLIRKILKEESLKHSLIDELKNNGIKETSELVGGFGNLLMILNIKTPMDFLHLFDDLDIVQSEEESDLRLFRYKPKHNLMVYDRKIGDIYISYDEIWSVLEDNFGLKYSEIQELTNRWLDEVYNLRGITIQPFYPEHYRLSWMRSII